LQAKKRAERSGERSSQPMSKEPWFFGEAVSTACDSESPCKEPMVLSESPFFFVIFCFLFVCNDKMEGEEFELDSGGDMIFYSKWETPLSPGKRHHVRASAKGITGVDPMRFRHIDPVMAEELDTFFSTHDTKRAYVVIESNVAHVTLTDFFYNDPDALKGKSFSEMVALRQANPNFNRVSAINLVKIGVNPELQKLGIAKALIDYIKYKAREGGWKILIVESVINPDLYAHLSKRDDCTEQHYSRNFVFRL